MGGGRGPGVRLAAAALAVAAAATGSGCSAGGGSDDASGGADACAVLEGELPAATFGPSTVQVGAPPDAQTGTVLAWALEALDPSTSDVIVYLDPGSPPEALDDLDAALRERPGVEHTEAVDQDATFEDFQDLFEGNDEMLANVRPEDLPTSVRVRVAHDDAEDLLAWAGERDGVFETRNPSTAGRAVLVQTLTKQADRDAWADLADRLDDVDGDPRWATAGAATVRQLLDEGVDAPIDASADLTAARDDLDAAMEACAPS